MKLFYTKLSNLDIADLTKDANPYKINHKQKIKKLKINLMCRYLYFISLKKGERAIVITIFPLIPPFSSTIEYELWI